mmetsp:Transcript_55514/g.176287  ORF Transcript_55514/g.176287 Transcript_55514/m.176287 type:complete len:159 (+) Transcript_55514:156-632(+)
MRLLLGKRGMLEHYGKILEMKITTEMITNGEATADVLSSLLGVPLGTVIMLVRDARGAVEARRKAEEKTHADKRGWQEHLDNLGSGLAQDGGSSKPPIDFGAVEELGINDLGATGPILANQVLGGDVRGSQGAVKGNAVAPSPLGAGAAAAASGRTPG